MLFELSQNRRPVVQSVDWEWHSPMAKATGQVHGGPMKCSLYVLMILMYWYDLFSLKEQCQLQQYYIISCS